MSRGLPRRAPDSMLAMRATAPGPDARPRTWRWLVLAVVTLVATTLALSLALHHDDGAPTIAGIEQSLDAPTLGTDVIVDSVGTITASASGAAGVLVCSLLILCCVAILLSKLRTRRAAATPGALQRAPESRPSLASLTAESLVSLTALSISRT